MKLRGVFLILALAASVLPCAVQAVTIPYRFFGTSDATSAGSGSWRIGIAMSIDDADLVAGINLIDSLFDVSVAWQHPDFMLPPGDVEFGPFGSAFDSSIFDPASTFVIDNTGNPIDVNLCANPCDPLRAFTDNDFFQVTLDNWFASLDTSFVNLDRLGEFATAPQGFLWLFPDDLNVQPVAVPEPSTLALFAAGLLGLFARRRKTA